MGANPTSPIHAPVVQLAECVLGTDVAEVQFLPGAFLGRWSSDLVALIKPLVRCESGCRDLSCSSTVERPAVNRKVAGASPVD